MKKPLIFSFDVESVGLYGKEFWVGYVVMDKDFNIHDSNSLYVKPSKNWGTKEDFNWIKQNVLPHYDGKTDVLLSGLKIMRSLFWDKLQEWKNKAHILVDCGYPVETNFLAKCVRNDEHNRKWQAPYPLIDLASILIAEGIDPLTQFERLDKEIKHHPMWDAHQSARIYFEIMNTHEEEDLIDYELACAARKSAREQGTTQWEDIKRKLVKGLVQKETTIKNIFNS